MEQKLDNFIIINFIKAKSYGKTNFNEHQLEKTDSFDFVGDSCQKLGIRKDILVQIKKYANAFVLKSGYLLDRYGWYRVKTYQLFFN